MDRVSVLACVFVVAVTAAGAGGAATGVGGAAGQTGPTGPPDDDYPDRDCTTARTVSPNNTTTSGQIDYEGDRDTFRFPVADGDTVAFRISTGESAHEFTLEVHMLESEWTGRVKPGGNARAWGDWNLGVVLKDPSLPGYARAFSVTDDTMCVTVHDDPPGEDAYPVAWSLHMLRNEVPGWYRTEDPAPTPTASPTPASTPTPTASPTPANAQTSALVVDTDGDGVPDDEDYAPRDARVQNVGDVRVVPETATPSSNLVGFGPGFGPVAALLAAVLGLALLASRREEPRR